MNEELEFLKLVAGRLTTAGIPYMLTGSMAMAFYAVPRMTRDVDLVVSCRAEDVATLLAIFGKDCYLSEEAVTEAVANHGMFNIIHTEWAMKADFVIRQDHEYRQLEFSRRRVLRLDGCELSVVAPEDLILSKLAWAKDSGSESQHRDVRQLLAAVPDLDFAYLEQWADVLGVRPRLNELKPR